MNSVQIFCIFFFVIILHCDISLVVFYPVEGIILLGSVEKKWCWSFHELSDQIGSRQVLIFFVLTGFVLCGIVEQSASVALRANSTSSYSAAEFAEYVENTSYITRYCQPPSENENRSGNSSVHVVRSIPHIEVSKNIIAVGLLRLDEWNWWEDRLLDGNFVKETIWL